MIDQRFREGSDCQRENGRGGGLPKSWLWEVILDSRDESREFVCEETSK